MLCVSCGADENGVFHITGDQATCQDCIDIHMFDASAKIHNIKYATWSCDKIKDFLQLHSFQGVKYAQSANHYCCQGWGRVEIEGNRWLDIWKAADKICEGTRCDHRFVEGFTLRGDTLNIIYGS